MDILNTPKYCDFWWDTAPPEDREEVILNGQLIPVLLYAKEHVPFYREHYRHIPKAAIIALSSFEEYADVIPPITKSHVASNHPEAFMPRIEHLEIDRNRGKYWRFGTGGTTSKPVLIMHSMSDWRAMALHANRCIEFDFYEDPFYLDCFQFNRGKRGVNECHPLETPLKGAKVFGAYNADHVTNNIYSTMLTALGCDFYWRASTRSTVEDNYELMQGFKVNGVLAPPEDASCRQKKGTTLDEFLRLDAKKKTGWRLNHTLNRDFKFVFWSSMPISSSLMDYLLEVRRIPYIKGHFGSTEVCPTASTCSCHPRKFHLGYGPSLVIAKSLDFKGLARPDEMGLLLVSKIGSTTMAGVNTCPTGMVFLNYMTGDGARLSKDGDTCACGRNTPLIYDMQRIEFHKGKALHGCQVE